MAAATTRHEWYATASGDVFGVMGGSRSPGMLG